MGSDGSAKLYYLTGINHSVE